MRHDLPDPTEYEDHAADAAADLARHARTALGDGPLRSLVAEHVGAALRQALRGELSDTPEADDLRGELTTVAVDAAWDALVEAVAKTIEEVMA